MQPSPDFNPAVAAKKLLREARSGALATLTPGSGDPYCSLVNVATTVAGAPVLLVSNLALHTRNILSDPRASLMLDERKAGDPLEGARVMLMARCVTAEDPATSAAYLRRHPDAEMYASFTDFAFYRMEIGHAHLVAGFGRIVDLKSEDVLTDIADAKALIDAEADAIAHMNTDHADACRLYATRLLGAAEGEWRCVGIDPEGVELQNGQIALRLPFPRRITAPGPLRATLKELAEAARSK